MAFSFEKAICVVAGTFNTYILHPDWLAKCEVIESGVEVGILRKFTQPGFSFLLPNDKTTWRIAPNGITVESRDPSFDCGATVAKVLRALPETPIQGLGNSVTYTADLSELSSLADAIQSFPQASSPNPDETVVQRTFHVAVSRGEFRTTNIHLALLDTKIELSCNVHEKLEDREVANEAAIAAAEQFFDDRTSATSLARHFFGANVSP